MSSTTDHRLDKRLLRRRGWIDPETLERELAALPDVSDKATRAGAGTDPGGAPGESPAGSGAGTDGGTPPPGT